MSWGRGGPVWWGPCGTSLNMFMGSIARSLCRESGAMGLYRGRGGGQSQGPYRGDQGPCTGIPSPSSSPDWMADTQIPLKRLPSSFRWRAVITTHHQETSRCPNISVICTLNTLIFDHKDWANLQSVENRCDSDPYQHFFEKISETIDKCKNTSHTIPEVCLKRLNAQVLSDQRTQILTK